MYIDRPRQKSADAKWERHLASNDPVFEFVVLQAVFRLVKQCDQLIHSTSNFAEILTWEMESTGKPIVALNIDSDKPFEDVFNDKNVATKNISQPLSSRRG